MIIGLHGRAQAGKDTVYERALAIWGAGIVERRSFAGRVMGAALRDGPTASRRERTVLRRVGAVPTQPVLRHADTLEREPVSSGGQDPG